VGLRDHPRRGVGDGRPRRDGDDRPVIQHTTTAPVGPVSQNMTFAGPVTDDAMGWPGSRLVKLPS
jgi:hypothetical protein